jgi:hypothetical protein
MSQHVTVYGSWGTTPGILTLDTGWQQSIRDYVYWAKLEDQIRSDKLDSISQSLEVRNSKMDNRSSRSAVEEQLQKKENLSVCCAANKMELATALWVKSRCGCGEVPVRD